ncbi:MAG: hypothetical protein RIS17_72 [Pseudomonadota bacterium]|jgi:hypothetical protein
MAIGQELLNVPMGDMIRQMAFAIAEAQVKLDASSIEVAEMMGGLKTVQDEDGKQTFDDSRVFFGYEMMTVKEAEAYLAADEAISGGDKTALTSLINSQKSALPTAEQATGLIRVPTRVSMLELGFSPTFYQFVDTIIEVKIAIKITRTVETTRSRRDTASANTSSKTTAARFGLGFGSVGARFGTNSNSQATTSQVDATYAAKYSYSAEGSSLLRTKLVPLPPPPILEERIRRLLDEEGARRRKALEKELATPTPP